MEKAWWKGSVVYQIYPRSFKDSNGDGIGDLQGVIEKLDYLKWLGIDIIWLSPIYKSPNVDNGYDISDYCEIMDEFGTMADFDRLLEAAHSRGLRIMLDLVVNHTSDQHNWFVQSKKAMANGDLENPYRDFYYWRRGDENEPLNHWESYFGGAAWQYDEQAKSHYLHLFAKEQPDLNWENPRVRESVYDMMKWWLDKGIDGFRMDVINFISKVEGLPEGKPIEGTEFTEKEPLIVCGPKLHNYLKEMNKKVLSNYEVITVGETPAISVEEAEKITKEEAGELNMVFQFEHMDVENEGSKWSNKRFSLTKLRSIIDKWQNGLNTSGWNSLYWNNHDQPRVVSRFGNDEAYWNKSAKMLATCLHMLKGTPYIYQGEEIGMTNIRLNHIESYKDIETINAYKKYTETMGVTPEDMMQRIHNRSRDNARTPMQWDDSAHAGFTTGIPWFDVNQAYSKINAKLQIEDDDSILNYYRELISIRKKYDIIVHGDYRLLCPESEALFVYIRVLNEQKLLTICNFTGDDMTFEIPEGEGFDGIPKCLISNYSREDYQEKMNLKPYEAIVYLYN